MWKYASLFSLVHMVNIQSRAGKCKMQETFSERRSSSIWVIVGHVNLLFSLVMHVETDILLTLLGKCMLFCFFMDCGIWVVGWTKPISTSSHPSPDVLGWRERRVQGGGNWYYTDLLICFKGATAAIDGVVDIGPPPFTDRLYVSSHCWKTFLCLHCIFASRVMDLTVIFVKTK